MALATVHYELHLLRGDRWVIDAVLRNRDEILALARGIAERAEADGVRVIKECASAADGRASALTLFEVVRPRPKPPRRRRVAAPAEAPPPAAELPAAERRLEVRPQPTPTPPWWQSTAGMGGIAAGGCAAGLAMLAMLL